MRRFRKHPRFPLVPVLLALPLLAGGCATVFHGTRQKVEIFTDPPRSHGHGG